MINRMFAVALLALLSGIAAQRLWFQIWNDPPAYCRYVS